MIKVKLNLRKIFAIAVCLAVIVAFSGCKKHGAITVENEQSLTQEVYADDISAKKILSFTTTGTWTSRISEITPSTKSSLAGSPDWILLNPDHGDQSGYYYNVEIILVPNYTGENRTAVITISCEGEEINITVTQKGVTQNGEVLTIPEDGVLINGVVWAKFNVDAPGTFAATPESFGMLYQWNRNIGWHNDDIYPIVNSNGDTIWNYTYPEGIEWIKANDPSPKGWRIPAYAEIERLLDDTKVDDQWTSQNGIYGRLFTDKASGNSIFIPAAGYIFPDNVSYNFRNMHGYYWSSTHDNLTETFAYMMNFDELNEAGLSGYDCGNGCSVRCVAEN